MHFSHPGLTSIVTPVAVTGPSLLQQDLASKIKNQLLTYGKSASHQTFENVLRVFHGERAVTITPGLEVTHALADLATDYGQLTARTREELIKKAADFLAKPHEHAPGVVERGYEFMRSLAEKGANLSKYSLTFGSYDSGRDYFRVRSEEYPLISVKSGYASPYSLTVVKKEVPQHKRKEYPKHEWRGRRRQVGMADAVQSMLLGRIAEAQDV